MCQKDNHIAELQKQYLDQLLDNKLLIDTGVPGVYGKSGEFESIIEGLQALITQKGAHLNPEVIHFPPVLNRANYLCTDHIHNFPDLLGSLHSFTGNERDHLKLAQKLENKEDWTTELTPTDLVMVPAACYNLYPTATGTLPEGGRLVDVRSFVFRHEPSEDPARMQIFRMREYVRLGAANEALNHRNEWIDTCLKMFIELGLEAKKELANDPFFGRGGKMMKATQKEQDLKYEITIPITCEEKRTAVASSNYHMDHFGNMFDIKTSDGNTAHSACVGWGLERITLALLKVHGFKPASWPKHIKDALGI